MGPDNAREVVAVVKRMVEASLALLLLLLVLPVLAVCVVGSAIALRAWPFFAHVRVGRDGRRFRIYKIRTLPVGTSPYADKYDLCVVQSPPFTRALRRLHLDELPQLWLVVTGKMALVGPRPEMQFLHDRMDPVFAAERTSIRPGCTGLWQISECSTGLIDEAPEYDRFYVRHRTLRLDLWILLRTVLLLLPVGTPRLVRLDQLPRRAVEVIDLTEPVTAMAVGD